MTGSWLLRFHPVPRPRTRVLCLPGAGVGPSACRDLAADLAPSGTELVTVQLPGRGPRWREPAPDDLDGLLDELEPVASELRDAPLALLGHSLGALIAYELVHRVGADLPLFVAACPAPHLPVSAVGPPGLDDAALVERLRGYGGTPPEVLGDPDLLELLLPAIRADFALADGYTYTPKPPLRGPLVVLGGLADPLAGAADLDAWREHTTGRFTRHIFDGDHFFLYTGGAAVARVLSGAGAGAGAGR